LSPMCIRWHVCFEFALSNLNCARAVIVWFSLVSWIPRPYHRVSSLFDLGVVPPLYLCPSVCRPLWIPLAMLRLFPRAVPLSSRLAPVSRRPGVVAWVYCFTAIVCCFESGLVSCAVLCGVWTSASAAPCCVIATLFPPVLVLLLTCNCRRPAVFAGCAMPTLCVAFSWFPFCASPPKRTMPLRLPLIPHRCHMEFPV
jgi:hypothetical protein